MVLVTGSAGFIGHALTLNLLNRGEKVIGIDNHNDYYDPKLKEDRLNLFKSHANYIHIRIDLDDRNKVNHVFQKYNPNKVINLAAQAGVRYSIENPHAYIQSNIVGFINILEACRHHHVEHLIYASSSSVYGANTNLPFSTQQNTNHPLSLYAASKKSNELMSHCYSHLYGLPTTGLRFFTAYGPWGRPDMALFKFTQAILNNEPVEIFNNGNHRRDFTYIDDVVEGIIRVLYSPVPENQEWNGKHPDAATSSAPWRIYNIGNSNPVNLMEYIFALEKSLGKTAIKKFLPIQSGDVVDTYADADDFFTSFGFKPKTSINEGIEKFVVWYLEYFNKSK
jgi:UDP-glucuronate 4-epimerase